jgi:hypothetical protein
VIAPTSLPAPPAGPPASSQRNSLLAALGSPPQSPAHLKNPSLIFASPVFADLVNLLASVAGTSADGTEHPGPNPPESLGAGAPTGTGPTAASPQQIARALMRSMYGPYSPPIQLMESATKVAPARTLSQAKTTVAGSGGGSGDSSGTEKTATASDGPETLPSGNVPTVGTPGLITFPLPVPLPTLTHTAGEGLPTSSPPANAELSANSPALASPPAPASSALSPGFARTGSGLQILPPPEAPSATGSVRNTSPLPAGMLRSASTRMAGPDPVAFALRLTPVPSKSADEVKSARAVVATGGNAGQTESVAGLARLPQGTTTRPTAADPSAHVQAATTRPSPGNRSLANQVDSAAQDNADPTPSETDSHPSERGPAAKDSVPASTVPEDSGSAAALTQSAGAQEAGASQAGSGELGSGQFGPVQLGAVQPGPSAKSEAGTALPDLPPKLPQPETSTASPSPGVAQTPASGISMRIATPGASTVDLQLAERDGQVHVAVRTPDSALGASLRQDLNTLVDALERSGFHAEAITPSSAAMGLSAAGSSAAGSSAAGSSLHAGQNAAQPDASRQEASGHDKPGHDRPSHSPPGEGSGRQFPSSGGSGQQRQRQEQPGADRFGPVTPALESSVSTT